MIYFIQAVDGGLIKIGYSTEPQKRIAEIQRMSPVQLKILTTIEGNRKLEGEIHRNLSYLRSHGEWFTPSDELINFITNPEMGLPSPPRKLTLGQARRKMIVNMPTVPMFTPVQFRLKELMTERHLTFKEVSQGAQVSTAALYKMRENKQKQFGIEVFNRLLDYFDCEPGDLITRVKNGHQ